MDTDNSAVVGAFVVAALALAMAAILFFGGTRFFERSVRAVVIFEGSVAGLDVGAPATFRGVGVGSVRDISVHLSPEGWARTYVYLELLPGKVVLESSGTAGRTLAAGIENLVAKGLRAQLTLQSFVTGQLRVDLDFQPGTPAQLAAVNTGGVPQIPAIPSNLERLQNAISELPLRDLAQATLRTMASGEHLMNHLDAALDPLIAKLNRSLDAASITMETATEAIAHFQADGSETLRAFDQLLEHAQRQVDDRGADLATTLRTTSRAAGDIAALAESTDSLVAQRSQFRGDLDAAAHDLAASASSLRGFAQQIERNPSTLVRGTGE